MPVHAEPCSPGSEILACDNSLFDLGGRGGLALEELVTVGGHDQGHRWIGSEQQGQHAHGPTIAATLGPPKTALRMRPPSGAAKSRTTA
jgi:hypothetical protein